MTRDAAYCCSLTLSQRGEHDIEHGLVFSNHTGYVFHDSRGIESGATEEVGILKELNQIFNAMMPDIGSRDEKSSQRGSEAWLRIEIKGRIRDRARAASTLN